jgi:alcohol dehydrogenase (cytochrome c)
MTAVRIGAVVYQGVLYVTTHAATMASTSRPANSSEGWGRISAETPRIVCCGIIDRGAAIYDGKIIRTTLDANDRARRQDRQELWRQKAADIKEGLMTVAPLVATASS